ncbi:MAG: c-type cytochrome [Sphingomonas sp.]
MRRPLMLIVPIAAVAVVSLALTQQSTAATPTPPITGPAAGAPPVIAARQAGFKLSLASFVALKAAIARGDDVKTLVLPASAIAGWGKAIPAMFPPNSAGPTSEALPNVWSDRAGFEAAATAMSDAATSLAMLAKAGDTAGVAAQFGELGKTCGGCHTKYREEEKK